jgi:hypothetical protein
MADWRQVAWNFPAPGSISEDNRQSCQGWGRGFESHRPLQIPRPQTFSAIFRTAKSPTVASIRALSLAVRYRNVPAKRSPNGLFSPKLGAWPIYSTSFYGRRFSGLASFLNRKAGIPFAWWPPTISANEPADLTPSPQRHGAWRWQSWHLHAAFYGEWSCKNLQDAFG